MNEWWYMHQYFKLVRRDLAPTLACNQDHYPLILRTNASDQPILECLMCLSKTRLGAVEFSDIVAIVKEHFVEG